MNTMCLIRNKTELHWNLNIYIPVCCLWNFSIFIYSHEYIHQEQTENVDYILWPLNEQSSFNFFCLFYLWRESFIFILGILPYRRSSSHVGNRDLDTLDSFRFGILIPFDLLHKWVNRPYSMLHNYMQHSNIWIPEIR